MMSPGVRPIICLASEPTASTSLVLFRIATTEGSRMTIPLFLSYTKQLAVPRSIPRSFMKCLVINRSGIPPPAFFRATTVAKLTGVTSSRRATVLHHSSSARYSSLTLKRNRSRSTVEIESSSGSRSLIFRNSSRSANGIRSSIESASTTTSTGAYATS